MIGAALVGLPYAFYYTGIPLGVALNVIIGILTSNSSLLYFMVKDLCGDLKSFSEIGFKL
jgi:amino acid permease